MTKDASALLRVGHLDEDSGLLLVTAKRLERLGHEHHILSSTTSPEAIAAMRVNALIVNLAIIGPKCWDWLERLCRLKHNLSIVVCTRSSTATQRIRALRLGADDWIGKPCHPEELIARLEVAVRHRQRIEPQRDAKPILAGKLEIRRNQHQAFVAECSLDLTRREFQLLELLASYEGCVVERKFIYQSLWGYSPVRGDRSVDVFVRKVRYKLELVSPDWGYIHTHYGIGYRFAAERLDSSDSESKSVAA
jgi:DNA-binding response OmpR family regulator